MILRSSFQLTPAGWPTPMHKKVPSLASGKERRAKADLPSKRPATAPKTQYRRSIAEIIDEYRDGRAKTIRS